MKPVSWRRCHAKTKMELKQYIHIRKASGEPASDIALCVYYSCRAYGIRKDDRRELVP